MPVEAGDLLRSATGFALVLIRIAGMFVFVPLPGARSASPVARVMLAAIVAAAMRPLWPETGVLTGGQLLFAAAAETALGLSIGLAVTVIEEAFLLGAQTLSLQAGYSFATTIDPTSQADSSVLQVFMGLMSGLLFFSFGLHVFVMRAVAESLVTMPPGTGWHLSSSAALITLAGEIFPTGLRLAMPVIALLLLVDVSLALLGRINAQLQLLTLAFPAKMAVGLGVLAGMIAMAAALYHQFAARSLEIVRGLIRN
jgi:flagellar biosynthesis protein FliR